MVTQHVSLLKDAVYGGKPCLSREIVPSCHCVTIPRVGEGETIYAQMTVCTGELCGGGSRKEAQMAAYLMSNCAGDFIFNFLLTQARVTREELPFMEKMPLSSWAVRSIYKAFS